MNSRPLIGVGVIIVKDGKVLMGKRKNSHGNGCWQFPGGHLEYFESVEGCAMREVLEETGLRIADIRMGPFTNDFFSNEAKHYVTLFVVSKYASGTPELKEPDQCEGWEWFEWDNLPSPLFLPAKNLVAQGFRPETIPD